MKSTKRVHDFRDLELRLNEDSESPHTIFFKEHIVKNHTADKPSGRTLFVLNVPPYADEQGIKNAFSKAGRVQSVQFLIKPGVELESYNTFLSEINNPIFRVAYIVFDKVSELDKALKLTELSPMNSEDHQIKTGLKKWIDEYNSQVLLQKDLKHKIEEVMTMHDTKMAKSEKHNKKLAEEDDEGWITVTKKGKVQSFARTENVENKIMEKEEKKKKRKELKNFYTFQIRESKMKHIVSLRQKFEEDKKKIAQIKQTRRFKPF